MNYEEMSDNQVNKRVAALLGLKESPVSDMMCGSGLVVYPHDNEVNFDPCNNPSDAWPIIFENKIAMLPNAQGTWLSYGWKKWNGKQDFSPRKEYIDKNPLRAAMICFLKMKDAEK